MSKTQLMENDGTTLGPELRGEGGTSFTRLKDSWDAVEMVTKFAMLRWDSGSMTWVKFTGGGGPTKDVNVQNFSEILQTEDAGHSSGDSGIMPLAVRNDTLGNLVTTNLDYAPFQVSSIGALYVEASVSSVIPGVAAANLGKTRDAVAGAADVGVLGLAVRRDANTSAVDTDGDYAPPLVNELGYLKVAALNELDTDVSVILDSMDLTSGWSVLGDDTDNLATDLNHIEGVASLKFDKVNGNDNTIFAGIQKTITTIDLSKFTSQDLIITDFYIPSLAQVSYVFIRLGTNSTNYNEWRIPDEVLTENIWENLAFSIGDAAFAGNTGNGWNPSAVTYMAIGVAFDNQTNTQAGIRFDHIGLHSAAHTTAILSSEVSTSVSSPNINVLKWGNKVVDLGIGTVGTGTPRIVLASDQPKVKIEGNDAVAGVPASNPFVLGGIGLVGNVRRATFLNVGAFYFPAVQQIGSVSLSAPDVQDLALLVNGTTLSDSPDGTTRPMKIGGRGTTLFTEPSAVSANNDRVNAFFDLKGYQHNKVHPDRIAISNLFSSQVFNATLTATSSAVDLERVSRVMLYVKITTAGSPTNLKLFPQYSNDGGTTWYDLFIDYLTDFIFVPGQMPLTRCYPVDYPGGKDFRVRAVSVGTNGSGSTFTLTLDIEPLTNG